MDINTVREIVTVLSFATFIGIVGWAWSRRNRASFEEAGRTFSRFAEENMIEVHQRHVRIADPERLRGLLSQPGSGF